MQSPWIAAESDVTPLSLAIAQRFERSILLQLSTSRLRVRLFEPDDAPALAAILTDADVARYVPWDVPYSVDRARDRIAKMAGADFDHPPPGGLVMAVERASDGVLIGDAMIKHEAGAMDGASDPRQGVIGYVIAREHQRQGYATELARALVDRFFASPGTHRVSAWCDARNSPSIKVLERVGMRLEAEFKQGVWCKGEWVNERVYAKLREEWVATRPVADPR